MTECQKWRKKVAHAKAVNRGKITEQWINEGNRISPSTLKEFNALMKKADREFDVKSIE